MSLRIERVDLQPWGCFEDLSLPLSTLSGAVDLIYGRNATGKSTISRAERSLLYGIDERTQDGHTFDYADLRIGARLRLGDESVELARRKRRVDSLIDTAGEALAEDPIAPAMGGLGAEVYRELFQVDHDTLVKGGLELLEGGGEVGASLFAAAAGIAALHSTLVTFDAAADRLYAPRASSRVLNRALQGLREREKRMREATLRPRQRSDMSKKLSASEGASDALNEEVRDLDLRTRAIERIRAVAPLLDTHAERSEELEGFVDVPELAEEAASKRSEVEGRIRVGQIQRERTQAKIEKLSGEVDAISVDEEILGRAEEIRALKEDVSAVRKAAGDRRKREGELAEARTSLDAAAATVGVGPAEIEPLRRPATARRTFDGWLQEHGQAVSRRRNTKERVRETERQHEEAKAALAELPMPLETGALEVSFANALKAGPLTEQIHRLRAEMASKSGELDQLLGRLSPGTASIDEFRGVHAPSRAEVEQHIASADRHRVAVSSHEEELAALTEADAELKEEEDRLRAEGAPPSATALAEARASRNDRWGAIRQAVDAGAAPAIEEADSFEGAVTEADQIADLSIAAATRMERSARVAARGKRLEGRREALAGRATELEQEVAGLAKGWEEAWARTGLAAIDPVRALDWLSQRDAILELDAAIGDAGTQLEALCEREQHHREALAHQLEEIGVEGQRLDDLDVTTEAARQAIERSKRLAEDRAAAEADLASAARALDTVKREHQQAEAAWSEWNSLWDSRCEEAGIPAGSSVEAAQEIVRAVEDGLGQLARVEDLERRIAGIDGDRAEFESRVRGLCEDIAPTFMGLDPERGADALHERLVDQGERRKRRQELTTASSTARAELETIDGELEVARGELEALVEAAGCDDADDLPGLERRADRARALREELGEIERQVTKVGEGQFAELVAEADGFDRHSAAVEVGELHDQAEALRGKRDELNEAIGKEKAALEEADQNADAVLAAQEVELARGEVREAATSYAKTRLAAAVMRRAIERYRRLHQAPMLRRANELFTQFTLGSFAELFVDVDEEGNGVLFGREGDGVRKTVEQMSKGTREQLFLALRIAAIERYVETSGPVPVLFDDVFIESDEPCSEQIFLALGELAAKTQVIVLTHHHHLIEVGRRALADSLSVQELPAAASSLAVEEAEGADEIVVSKQVSTPAGS